MTRSRPRCCTGRGACGSPSRRSSGFHPVPPGLSESTIRAMSVGVASHDPAPPSVSMYVRPGSDLWSTSSGPTSNVDASRIPVMPSGVSNRSYTACFVRLAGDRFDQHAEHAEVHVAVVIAAASRAARETLSCRIRARRGAALEERRVERPEARRVAEQLLDGDLRGRRGRRHAEIRRHALTDGLVDAPAGRLRRVAGSRSR